MSKAGNGTDLLCFAVLVIMWLLKSAFAIVCSSLQCALTQGYRSKDNVDDFSKSGSNPANASLIKRFNQHSTMVLKSCDKKPAATATTAAASVETSTERLLPKDITVNGSIHIHAVTSVQNSTVISASSADVTGGDDVVDKHVRLCLMLLFNR